MAIRCTAFEVLLLAGAEHQLKTPRTIDEEAYVQGHDEGERGGTRGVPYKGRRVKHQAREDAEASSGTDPRRKPHFFGVGMESAETGSVKSYWPGILG